MIKLIATFNKKTFRLRVQPLTTVFEVTLKLRTFLVIKPEQALFIFFNNKLCTQSRTMQSIVGRTNKPIHIDICLENAFGAWGKSFVKCHTRKVATIYVVVITYSYYGLYNYTETTVHETLAAADAYKLNQRCSGRNTYADCD